MFDANVVERQRYDSSLTILCRCCWCLINIKPFENIPDHARDELYRMFWTVPHDVPTRPEPTAPRKGHYCFYTRINAVGPRKIIPSLTYRQLFFLLCKVPRANFKQAERLYVPQAIACDVPTRLLNAAAWSYAAGKKPESPDGRA